MKKQTKYYECMHCQASIVATGPDSPMTARTSNGDHLVCSSCGESHFRRILPQVITTESETRA